MADVMKERIAQLEDYIMKNCLWEFNSRAWDRKNQNEGILKRTMQLLCGEEVEKEKPNDRYYWAEAVYLTEIFKKRYSWILTMNKEEIKELIKGLKDRLDYTTITGSLNKELTDPLY